MSDPYRVPENDPLELLGAEAPSARLREQLERNLRRSRSRRRWAVAATVAIVGLGAGLLWIGRAPESSSPLAAELRSEAVFTRLAAVARALDQPDLDRSSLDELVRLAGEDPSLNVRLLSLDVLSRHALDPGDLRRLRKTDQAPIVEAHLQRRFASAPSRGGA